MSYTLALLTLLLLAGCPKDQPKQTDPNAEPLDTGAATDYAIKGDEFKVVLQERRGTDTLTVTAVAQRALSRRELRAVARSLAGSAKAPTIELLASQATHTACVKTRFALVRGGADPATSDACANGTLFWMDASEGRVLHWGAGAPQR